MNRLKTFLSLCLIQSMFIVCLFSQDATVSGIVSDQATGLPLLFANIQAGEKGTVADLDGTYSLSLAPGNYEIVFSYVGYKALTESVSLSAGQSFQLNVSLAEEVNVLQTATVTSGKFEKPLGEVTVSLEVIKPALIENTSKPTLDEALQKIPGVIVIDGQANIRGGSGFSQGAGSRVLLLVDDVPILQADAGFPNWDDVPVESIEQIEVLKGASSSLYGSSALNGIINVRTAYAKSKPETKFSVFQTTYFSPEDERLKWWDKAPFTQAFSGSNRVKLGKLDLVTGLFLFNQESFRKDTNKKFGRFNFNTRYRFNDRVTAGLAANFNLGESKAYFYWLTDTMGYVGAPTTISNRERFRFNIDPYATFFDKSGNRHRLNGRFYFVDNNNDLNQSNQSFMYYGEYQFQKRLSGSDFVISAGVVTQGTRVDAELYGDTVFTSRNFAGYIQLENKLFDRLNLSAGFRFEHNVLNNPGFTYSFGTVPASEEKDSKPVFRIGANYQVTDYTFLRASWGQGYRFPTVAEKFIFTDAGGFFVTPNPTLTPETGWSAEIAIKQGFKVGSVQGFFDIAAFYMRYEDMMEFNVGKIFNQFQSQNIGGTLIKGMEFTIAGQGKLGNVETSILAGYTYIEPEFLDFDNTQIPAGELGTLGQRNANNSSSDLNFLKYRSRHTAKLDIQGTYKRVSLGLESQYASRIEAIDAIFEFIISGLARYRQTETGNLVHSVRGAYQFTKGLKLSLILGNVANELYAIRPALLEGPRNLTARIDYKF